MNSRHTWLYGKFATRPIRPDTHNPRPFTFTEPGSAIPIVRPLSEPLPLGYA